MAASVGAQGCRQMSETREDPRFPGALIHVWSFVDDGAVIGRGTKIWHFCHVLTGTVIGENSSIGQNVMIGPRVKIGNVCKVQNNVSLYDGVELADDVFCGPSCLFTNVNNPRANVSRKDEFRTTPIGRGASIDANATIICGHSLGEYCFIGVDAVVTKDVPAFARIAWTRRGGAVFVFRATRWHVPIRQATGGRRVPLAEG
jgi:UDP-2-acetamido-3-amino-2,3-dideoxy-glucuronate N-acetyltransferase